MTCRLILREEARDDIESAASWYDDREAGLGERFVAEVRHVLRQIAERPAQFRAVRQNVRRALLQRFPYSIYFLVDTEETVILTVVHKRRHPEIWRQRLHRGPL